MLVDAYQFGRYGTWMPSTGRPRPLRAWHRCAALLVGLLWAICPALAILHVDAQLHRFCAEHRVLEEAGGSVPATPADLARSAPPGDARVVQVGVAPAGGGAHDDCAFAPYCRFGQLLQALAEAGVLQPPATRSLELPSAAPGSAVAILSLAPKTSPPVSAV